MQRLFSPAWKPYALGSLQHYILSRKNLWSVRPEWNWQDNFFERPYRSFSGETSGIVSYNGIAIDRLNMPLLRRQKISYVEQTPVMLNMSVKAFLNFGIEQSQSVAETQKMLIEMLEIDDLLTKDINENGNNLSGGEKQKLSIVRALSKESFLILLDEPTSALDKDSIEKLMTLLKQRKMQAIILLVSHDQKVLEQCDEVIDISDLRGN